MKLANTIALIAILVLSGCASLIIGKPDGRHKESGSAVIDDTVIKRDVNIALSKEPAISSTDILVTSSEGVVTLKGKVKTMQLKNRATAIALGVVGVRAVNNQLLTK